MEQVIRASLCAHRMDTRVKPYFPLAAGLTCSHDLTILLGIFLRAAPLSLDAPKYMCSFDRAALCAGEDRWWFLHLIDIRASLLDPGDGIKVHPALLHPTLSSPPPPADPRHLAGCSRRRR